MMIQELAQKVAQEYRKHTLMPDAAKEVSKVYPETDKFLIAAMLEAIDAYEDLCAVEGRE